MSRLMLVCLSLIALSSACGDDDGNNTPQPDGGDQCPQLAGTWTIDDHCGGAPLLGMTVPVTQSGCTFTTSGAFAGFTGTLAADGSFTMSGMGLNGMNVECTGTATATMITETCTGNCDVVLTK